MNINKVNRINIFQISEESYEFNKTAYGKTTVIKLERKRKVQRQAFAGRKVQIIRSLLLYTHTTAARRKPTVEVSVILHRRQ